MPLSLVQGQTDSLNSAVICFKNPGIFKALQLTDSGRVDSGLEIGPGIKSRSRTRLPAVASLLLSLLSQSE